MLFIALLLNSGAGAQTPSAIDAALELYRYRLVQSGMRVRAYPEEAMRQKLEGTADINLVIAADGTLHQATLVRSTRHAELDRHALELLGRAVPLTEIPSTLQNKAFAVRVVIAFSIPD